MTKTAKEIIPYSELLAKVQSLLLCEECRNIQIDALDVYSESDGTANWSLIWMRRSGDESDLRACKDKILNDVRHLRKIYDSGPRS